MSKKSNSKKYKWARLPDGRNTLEHRIIMSNHLGRPLRKDECVHHIDHNGKNNSIKNLELYTLSEHSKLHAPTSPGVDIVCNYCGQTKNISKANYNRALKHGRTVFWCSKKCAGKNKVPPLTNKYNCDIDIIIKDGLKRHMTGYEIAKSNNLNRKTVYNRIKKLNNP
jgi:hypothetical protein